jgi:alkylation response protein AidB-like acyl-CoA dehydrogenase
MKMSGAPRAGFIRMDSEASKPVSSQPHPEFAASRLASDDELCKCGGELMTVTEPEGILEAVREIEPVVRAHSEAGDRDRRIPRPVLDALAGAGLHRMLTPKSLGGLELDPITCARVIEEVASFDSAAGWSLMVGNSVDWWCSRLPREGPEEIYASSADVIIAGAFHPPMQARVTDGGYHVSGPSPLASNCHDASWMFVTATLTGSDASKPPATILVICRASECDIVETWNNMGMGGKERKDIVLKDVFVPAARTWTLGAPFETSTHYQGPLYRLPPMGEVAIVVPPVPLGIGRAAITEFRAIAARKTPFGAIAPLQHRPAAQAKLARAEATLRAARALFYETLGIAWGRAKAGEVPTPEQKADLLLASAHSVSSAVQAVELVYGAAGTTGIYTRCPLERHFRDIQVLRQHGFTNETRYETVGQVYLGVPPEYGLVLL